MEQIGVRELNQDTSRVLARVQSGETIEITDRGRPVARLVPVGDNLAALTRLVASGRAVAPDITGPIGLPPVIGDPEVDSASVLAAMRDEERW